MAPGGCGNNFKRLIAEDMLRIKFMSASSKIALTWMPQKIFDEKSTSAQVMA